jgi:dihydroorotate dehydrogenase (fumarate)
MSLSTRYLGFELPHPLIPGASPLADDLDTVRRLEDAGAPMIVMRSLFEEQIVSEQMSAFSAIDGTAYSHPEALSYLPEPSEHRLGASDYLEQLARIKSAVSVPVVASLNGTSEGGWLRYAKMIEEAGADALELNLYEIAIEPEETGAEVEARELGVVKRVLAAVSIPVAVKLSPFYSSIANYAQQLDRLGVAGIVLFNRFYQPDIDPEQLEVFRVNLSDPSELLLRLRWIGALSGRVRASLAATGGVHSAREAVKALMAGADGVQMVSALLHHGPRYLAKVRGELARWLEEHEYASLAEMKGCMNLKRCTNPKMYERANYMRMLQSWSG